MGFIGSSSSSGGGSSTTLYYSKTYAEMQTLIGSSSIAPGATYFISDKGVEVLGVSTTAVSLEGRYLRSGEWNFVEYDFDNDHIQKEVDKRGNSVGCTALYLTYALLSTDPRSVFRWDDDTCINNTVWNAVFDCSSSDGLVFGNSVTEGSIVELSGDGGFQNNIISGTSEVTATTFTGTFSLNAVESGTTVDISGSSVTVSSGIFSQSSVIDFTAHTGTIENVVCNASNLTASDTCALTNLNIDAGTVTASGTANLTRFTCEGSTVTVSGITSLTDGLCAGSSTITGTGGSANRCKVLGGSTLTIAGTATATSILIQGASTANISGAAQASNAQLNQGNSLTISDNVDAIAVYMSTGAQCTATDNVMIEGLIMRNVGVLNFSDDVICSPGEIENQSTVTLSGDGNYGNCFWKGVNLTGSGTVLATNLELHFATANIANGATINNSYINLGDAGGEVIEYSNSQPNQYVTTQASTKEQTFTVSTNAIDFNAADVNHYTGIVVINSTDTIDTISNLSAATGAAPKRFRIKPTSGNTVTFASATATNIILPSGTATVTANGTNGDWIEFEYDGTNCYITEINNF